MKTCVEKRIVIYEKFDRLKIEYIKSLNYESFKNIKKKLPEIRGRIYSEEDLMGEYTMLQKFCKSTLECNGTVSRIYKSVNGARYYGVDSIQGISKCFKGFILEGTSTDIDQFNSHPTILEYLCKQNNINVPQLTYYNNNRDLVVSKNSNAKLDVISYINGNKTPTSDEFLRKFKLECETQIHDKLIKLPQYTHFYENISGSNIIGTVTFRIMESMEVKIIAEVVIPYLESQGIEIFVIMHDGVHISGDHYTDSDLLVRIAQKVNEKYPGLGAKFTYKEHSNYINDIDYQFFLEVERLIIKEFNGALFSSVMYRPAPLSAPAPVSALAPVSESSGVIKIRKVGDKLPDKVDKPIPKPSGKQKPSCKQKQNDKPKQGGKPSNPDMNDKQFADKLFASLMNS